MPRRYDIRPQPSRHAEPRRQTAADAATPKETNANDATAGNALPQRRLLIAKRHAPVSAAVRHDTSRTAHDARSALDAMIKIRYTQCRKREAPLITATHATRSIAPRAPLRDDAPAQRALPKRDDVAQHHASSPHMLRHDASAKAALRVVPQQSVVTIR